MFSAAQVGALFGSGGNAIDTSAIGAGSASAVPVRRPRGFDTPAVIAPWQDRTTAATPLEQKISRIRSARSLIDPGAAVLRSTQNNADLKSTFTIFKALDDLKSLADYASDKKRTPAERAALNAEFEKGLRDVQAFTTTASTRQLNLLFGEKSTRAESVFLAKTIGNYTGLGVVKSSKTDEIKDLTATDGLSVTLSRKQGDLVVQTNTIAVDFAGIDAPITLDKVLARLNERIAATPQTDASGNPVLDGTGVAIPAYKARFELALGLNGKTGLKLVAPSTESAHLSDPAAPPGSFVVANFLAKDGSSKDGVGQFSRIDGSVSGTLAQNSLGTIAGIDAEKTAFAKSVFATVKQPTRATAPRIPAPGNTTTPTRVNATAVDSKGFVYTVGTTSGDIGNQQGDAKADLFLSKYDSNGVVIFTRKLGAAGESGGASLVIDDKDNVIVAGQTSANLSVKNVLKGEDTLVAKFSSDGKELFAVALDSLASDRASAVAVDADGNILIGGQVKGVLRDQTSVGGQDAMLIKMSGTNGSVQAIHQFGTSGTDSFVGLAVRDDGSIAAATNENGQATLHIFDGTDITTGPLQSTTVSQGIARALAYDSASNSLVLAGTTTTGVPGVAGYSGATDGFVLAFDGALAQTAGTHVGSSGSDFIDSLSIAGGKLLIGGRTNGSMGEKKIGKTDAFVAQYDLATLAREQVKQFGEVDGTASQVVLAAVDHGPGTLAKLGLREGDLAAPTVTDLMNATSVRAGDHFYVAVDGGKPKKVEIAANETFKSLASKLRTMFGNKIDVRVTDTSAVSKFEIRQKGESRIELTSGSDGADALGKLGMQPTRLLSSKILFNLSGDPKAKKDEQRPGGTFNFGLTVDWSIGDESSAKFVATKLGESIGKVQTAYRSLYFDENRARAALRVGGNSSGRVSPYLQRQNANYLDALRRMSASNASSSLI
jgi:trimeric autotransporter adhesin